MTNRHLWILVACEAMAYCLMAIILSVSAVSGYFLAPVRSLALLPLITEVLGSCVSTIPAAYLMKKHGRRIGFLVGSAVGVVGSLLCFYAIYTNNFWLLVASTPLLGVLTGFGEYTRYAAADLFDDERRKSRAISFVVCSGIVAAFVGPSLANWSNELTNVRFAGAYLACLALCLISFVLFWFYQDPAQQVEDDTAAPVATWREVIRAPLFVVGTMSGVAAFLTMAVLMDATPIVMLEGGYHFSHTTEVIQWHLLAMFAPSLFTGRLIEKLGVLKTIYLGIGLGALGIVIGLAGTDYFNFLISLILVGLSWNFMYVAGQIENRGLALA